MSKMIIVFIAAIALVILFVLKSHHMILSSPAFENGQSIPAKYTCDGDNVSPPLSWSQVPENTQSFVLIVDDPDAPGGDFVHWLLWNIPAETTSLNETATVSDASAGKTDFGKPGYGGPCPPSGTHRYQFKLYALSAKINLAAGAGKKELEQTIKGRVLDQAQLEGRYTRVLK